VQAISSYKYEGVARALSSISHLGDSTGGTISIFRREKMLVDGKVLSIPTISGNSFRGLLRDKGMMFMLRELGSPQLSVPAFHFLTSGGALTKEAGRGIDFAESRRLRELIPLVSIFGGATGRRIMEGKLQVGKWLPICKETRELLPESLHDLPEVELSMYDMTDLHSFTRTDDAKSERWQGFLPAPERELLSAPKVKLDKEGAEVALKDAAQQMRYTQQVLIAGTKFFLWMQLQDVTDLEKAAFASALYEWQRSPFIGGQSRHGCGLVDLNLERWQEILPQVQMGPAEVSPSEEYLAHLRERKEEILDCLKELA